MSYVITNSEKLKNDNDRDLRINSNVVLLECAGKEQVCIGLVVDYRCVVLVQEENLYRIKFEVEQMKIGGTSLHGLWKIVGECDIQIDVTKVFNRL